MRSSAAAQAASLEDAVGITTCDGNHTMVSAIRSARVSMTQVLKHR